MKIGALTLLLMVGLIADGAWAQQAPATPPSSPKQTQAEKAHASPPLQEPLESKSQSPFLDRLWTLMGVFHPAAVHFPIAMILVSAMFVALRWKFKTISEDVGFYTLLLGAFSTIPVSLMGWAFSYQMGYGSPMEGTDNEVFYHRWGGIAVTVFAVLFALVAIHERYRPSMNMRKMWHAGVVVSAMLVGLVGHWGGSLTYGEDLYAKAFYTFMGWEWKRHAVPAVHIASNNPADPIPTLTPVPTTGSTAATPTQNATASTPTTPPSENPQLGGGDPAVAFFFNRVKPVLETHCTKCHGAMKQKGKFALHTRESAMEPDKNGNTRIVPGQPEQSKLIQLIRTTDEMDLMPPTEESKLAPVEVEILVQWISQGAQWPENVELQSK